jgi:plastocyanin
MPDGRKWLPFTVKLTVTLVFHHSNGIESGEDEDTMKTTLLRRIGKSLAALLLVIGVHVETDAATVTVEMRNNVFVPANITIQTGDTVTWVQRGSNHDTVSYDGLWDSGFLRLNDTFSFKFNNAGSFGYYCTPHEQVGMIGNVTVQAGANQPPTVTLTAPASGATFLTTDSITFSATASDNGSVTKVEFFSDGNLVGTDTVSPYSVLATLTAGSHSITAKATDNAGAATTSAAVTITVNAPNQPPTVSLTAPVTGATFLTTDSITFSATASDDGSVTKVEFFSDGNLIGTDTSSPYSVLATLTAGSHSITAKATDNAGASTTSAAVTITVNAPNQPPTVSLTAPANGATFLATDSITFSATASDDGSVTKVEFFSDGNLIGTDTSSPYSVLATLSAGSHSITAKATDNAGASTTSAPVNITVNSIGNQSPTITLNSDQSGKVLAAPATVSLRATASDADGAVSQVEFFNDSTSIGVDTTAPYEVNLSNLGAGVYSFTAAATDNAGAKATSSAIQVSVADQPRITSITNINNAYVLNVSGTTSIAHILEATSDLVSWSGIATNTPLAGATTFTDAVNQPKRFYRIVVR